MKYLQEYKHTLEFENENISEFVKVKRNGNSKTYMRAQRLIYTETIRKSKQNSCRQEKILIVLLRETLFKYKPFYITPPTEREKENFLCIKYPNGHLLLRGINTCRDLKNLMKHNSVTKFIKNDPKKSIKNLPECDDTKEINYVFETKVESFTKNGKTTEYSRTA